MSKPGELELDTRMRAVLAQLTLVSNGRTARMDADRGGGSHRHYTHAFLVDWLDPLDAPQYRYLRFYLHETTEEGRLKVIVLAEDELDRIRISRGHEGIVETLDDLYDRIVTAGEGWPPRDVAVSLRTSVMIIRRARKERGRDQETGKPVEDATELSREDRRERVRHLHRLGRDSRAIAHTLGIPYSTVLRDLGKKRP